jgi:thioredoxin 1
LSNIKDIIAEDFDEILKTTETPLVLEFWMRSCSFCQKFKPIYEQLSEIYGERIVFVRLNMMKSIENLRLSEKLGVEQTPTTKVFCREEEVGEIVGYKSLDEAIEELKTILQSNVACGS